MDFFSHPIISAKAMLTMNTGKLVCGPFFPVHITILFLKETPEREKSTRLAAHIFLIN